MITKYLIKAGKPIAAILVILMLCGAYLLGSVSPVRAATIIIAASNSTSQWKSEATAVCTGSADQTVINKYLTTGNTVELAPGTFNINRVISVQSSTRLVGQGNSSIVNLQNAYIDVPNASNIEIDHLEITGAGAGSGILIEATSASVSNFNIHDIYCNATGSDDFEVYTVMHQISNVVFSRDSAINPDGDGFCIFASGTTNNLVSNVTFYKCSVQNAGLASSRLGQWICGIDTGENIIPADSTDLTINNIYVINCSVNGEWDAGYHDEYDTVKQNVVFTGDDAENAGKNPSFYSGCGYVLITGDVVEYNNTASSNAGGDLNLDGTIHTPIINGISPSNSTKTAIALNQGNCSGVIINLDATHKELVLYSNDGNAVNQQIDLGNYYAADDGNTYYFNGTNLIAQFTDYAVIGLVETTSAPPTAPAPSGGNTVGTVASTPQSSGGGYYNLYIKIVSTSVTGLSAGQQVWCAASIYDFPNLLTIGTTLSGNLDHSSGYWNLSPAAISSDATLSNMTISSGTLTPVFAAATTSYTDSVTNSVSSVTVSPTVNQGNATVKVNGMAVTSGQASGSISLAVGSTTITVMVTAQDMNTTDSYTISVTRAASAPSGGNTVGTVASTPQSSGGGYYNLYIKIVSTNVTGLSIGQQVWCAASINDFPNLLTVGTTLIGNLDNSSGYWNLSPVSAPAPSGNTVANVASTPQSSGGGQYNLYLQIVSTSVSGLSAGQQVWCAASINDFPNLLTVGTTLTGNLDHSSGYWYFSP
jgi:predicted secreted protein